jgi:hypothetical protein
LELEVARNRTIDDIWGIEYDEPIAAEPVQLVAG